MKSIAKHTEKKPKEPKEEVFGLAMVQARLGGYCCFYWCIKFWQWFLVLFLRLICATLKRVSRFKKLSFFLVGLCARNVVRRDRPGLCVNIIVSLLDAIFITGGLTVGIGRDLSLLLFISRLFDPAGVGVSFGCTPFAAAVG